MMNTGLSTNAVTLLSRRMAVGECLVKNSALSIGRAVRRNTVCCGEVAALKLAQ